MPSGGRRPLAGLGFHIHLLMDDSDPTTESALELDHA